MATGQEVGRIIPRDWNVPGLVGGNMAAASANTAKIQAALDLGGEVTVGTVRTAAVTYYITAAGSAWTNAALAIGSNTRLRIASNVTLRQAPGANANLLVTKSYGTAQTAVSVSWSSGITATVTWTAHPFSVGDYVALQGAAQSAFVGVFVVSAVVDANSFTIRLTETPLAAPSGTITGVKAVTNFDVEGGIWDYDYANNPSATFTRQHAIILAYAQRFSARAMRYRSVPKFCMATAAVRDFRISEQHADNGALVGPPSDGDVVKVYGPAMNGEVSIISGMMGDDTVSVQPVEPVAFAGYNITGGGSTLNISVREVGADNLTTTVVAVYLPGGLTPWRVDDIEIDTTGGSGRVKIAGDPAGADYASVGGNITIRGLKGPGPNVLFQLDRYCFVRQLVLEGFTVDDPGFSLVLDAAAIAGQVQTLTLRSWVVRNAQSALAAGATARIDTLNVEDMQADTVAALIAVSGAVIGTVNIERSALRTAFSVVSATVAAGGSGYTVNDTITLAGGTFYSAAVLKVTSISGGAVTGVAVLAPGGYRAQPGNPIAQASTSGGGTGATFNATWNTVTAPTLFTVFTAATVGTVNFVGNKLDSGCHSLARIQANPGTTTFTLRENNSDSAIGVSCNWTSQYNLRDNIFTNAFNGLVRVQDAGATQVFTIRASGNSIASSPPFVRLGGAELISVFSPDLKVDLAALQRTAASMAVASVGAGTIVANNLAVCDATGAANSWHQVTVPANVF